LFAEHAAIAVAGNESLQQLREALSTHSIIEQAKGIIMERRGMTPDTAFAVLARSPSTSTSSYGTSTRNCAGPATCRGPATRRTPWPAWHAATHARSHDHGDPCGFRGLDVTGCLPDRGP